MSVIQKRKRGGGKAKAKDKGRGGEKAEDGNKDRKKRQSTETQPSDGERSSEESVHSVGDEEDTLAASVDGNGDAVPDDALLGSIMAKILKTKVPSDAAGTPVLSRRRAVERKMEDEKLELKARAIVRNELREKRDAAHQPPRMESANYEKTLRKVSTSGVVKLFNAVQQHQAIREKAERAAREAKQAKQKMSKQGAPAALGKLSDIKDISKASFLELLKMGGSGSRRTREETE